jgi:hypothetical protein
VVVARLDALPAAHVRVLRVEASTADGLAAALFVRIARATGW